MTNINTPPDYLKVFLYTFLARTLGLTFAGELMEKGEVKAQVNYRLIAKRSFFCEQD